MTESQKNEWRNVVLGLASYLPDTARIPDEDAGPTVWWLWLIRAIGKVRREIFRPVEWPPTDSGPVPMQILVDGVYEKGEWRTKDIKRLPYVLILDKSIIRGWRLSEEAPSEASYD